MFDEDVFQFVEELQSDWPMLLAAAAAELGSPFHALLEDEELEAVFREFKVSAGPSA